MTKEKIVDILAVVLISDPRISLKLKEYYEVANKQVEKLIEKGIVE